MGEPSSTYLRSRELLSRGDSRLLVIDMQEKLLPAIPVREPLIANCVKLLRGAGVLGVPAAATEQYPRGLGATLAEITTFLPHRHEKLRFSAAECVGWTSGEAPDESRSKVVVAGIEAHVCVLQTVLDLLAAGFETYVVADAVGSRSELDWRTALDRMANSGAVVTTTESVLFEWCEVAGTDEFKQISRIITDR